MPLNATFESIVGHAHPKAVLRAAIAGGRVAHAYLFHGEAHIGKFMTALAFAKTGLCADPQSDRSARRPAPTSCNRCFSCLAVESGGHPDIRVVRPDGAQIKIDQIRELQEAVSYKPLIGSRKWFIVDEAEALNPEAGNRFLKTLEEPPDHSILILITARPHALLPTIRSRCQAVRFNPPPQQDLSPWLQKHRAITPAEAELLAVLSLGKIGLALEADPQVLKGERDRVLEALSPERLRNPSDVFDAPEDLAASQEQLSKTLDAVEIWLRDVLISRHASGTDLLINQDIPERIFAWGRVFSLDQVLETLSLIHLLKRAGPRNLNPSLVLETVLLKLRDAATDESVSASKTPER